jgi:hypothetical protein
MNANYKLIVVLVAVLATAASLALTISALNSLAAWTHDLSRFEKAVLQASFPVVLALEVLIGVLWRRFSRKGGSVED